MDPLGLVAGLADNPVPSLQLTGFGHGCVAHAHPEHGEAIEGSPQAILRGSAAQEDLVDDQACAGPAIAASPSVTRNSAARKASPTTTDPSGVISSVPPAPVSRGPWEAHE